MSFNEFIYFNKKKIVLFILGLVLIGSFLIYYFYNQNNNSLKDIKIEKNEEVLEKENIEKDEDSKKEVPPDVCFFDIKGEVKTPGVYSITCDKRIVDAIDVSGGLTKNSDTSVLNLSKKIEDGMVIIVYSKKEVDDYLNTLKKKEEKEGICSSSIINNDACSNNSNTSSNTLININTASLNELMTLSGIGEAKAKSIIAYRSVTPFKTIEDLLKVEGIGESLYASIKENITV